MKPIALAFFLLTLALAHASDQSDQDPQAKAKKQHQAAVTAGQQRPTYQSPSYAGVVNIHGLVDAGTPTPRPHQRLVGTQSDNTDNKPPGSDDGRR